MQYELQTPPVTADIIYDVVIIVLTQQHKNVFTLRTKKKEVKFCQQRLPA